MRRKLGFVLLSLIASLVMAGGSASSASTKGEDYTRVYIMEKDGCHFFAKNPYRVGSFHPRGVLTAVSITVPAGRTFSIQNEGLETVELVQAVGSFVLSSLGRLPHIAMWGGVARLADKGKDALVVLKAHNDRLSCAVSVLRIRVK